MYTNYSSVLDLNSQIDQTWKLSHAQILTLSTIQWALSEVGGVGWPLYTLGSNSLLAKRSLRGSFSNPLPNDQWTHEVSNWFHISLAMFQKMLVEIATGPPDTTAPGLYNSLPQLAEDTGFGPNYIPIICGWQKIHNSGFVNYHAGGFIAFIVLGFLVIASPLLIIPAVQKFALSSARRLAWIEDGDLQLLRMAHKGACGGENWDHADEEIPIPREGDPSSVGVLDIATNPDHPVISPRAITNGLHHVSAPNAQSGPATIVNTNCTNVSQALSSMGYNMAIYFINHN